MKILQINTTVNQGSTGRIAEQIGQTVLQNGQDSYIAFSRQGQPTKSVPLKIGTQKDVYQHVLISRLFDRHGFGSKNATRRFVEEIEIIEPDMIHLHNIHGYYLHIEVLFDFIKAKNIPVVWTFHDCWPFTGHCSYFDRFNCKKWKTECYSCPMTNYYPQSWGVDNSKKNYKLKKHLFNQPENLTIVTPSHWLKNLVKDSFLKGKRVQVIHNGIDLNVFNPVVSSIKKKLNLQDYKIILGVASIWDKRKGFEDFLKLADILDEQFQIVLVGLTDKQLNALPNNILGIKRTENLQELAQLYSASDVYINPTYSDNFPTTNIEALACGTPVITYYTGGSPEAISEESGIVVTKNDIIGLKNAIDEIVNSSTKFNSSICRERAVNHFNKEDRYQDYIKLYEEVLKNDKTK